MTMDGATRALWRSLEANPHDLRPAPLTHRYPRGPHEIGRPVRRPALRSHDEPQNRYWPACGTERNRAHGSGVSVTKKRDTVRTVRVCLKDRWQVSNEQKDLV